jgi:hypothetical protein
MSLLEQLQSKLSPPKIDPKPDIDPIALSAKVQNDNILLGKQLAQSRMVIDGLNDKIGAYETAIAQAIERLDKVERIITPEQYRLLFDAEISAKPDNKPANLLIKLGDGKARYFALRPGDNYAIHLDKVPTLKQKHELGAKYRYLFQGLAQDQIKALASLRAMDTGDPLRGVNGGHKTWTCGQVYNGNCGCDQKFAKAERAKADRAVKELQTDQTAKEWAISHGLLLGDPKPENIGSARSYYTYDPTKGSELDWQYAKRAKSLMVQAGISHTGLVKKRYLDMIRQAVASGIELSQITQV